MAFGSCCRVHRGKEVVSEEGWEGDADDEKEVYTRGKKLS